MPGWKRWGLVAAGVTLVVMVGYAKYPSRNTYEEAWDAESELQGAVAELTVADTYTPHLDNNVDTDTTDYSDYKSPPFRPIGSNIAEPADEESEEEQLVHILPIDTPRPTEPITEEVASNPHDPTSEAAQEATEEAAEEEAKEEAAEEAEGGDFKEVTTAAPVMTFETDPDAASTSACADPYDAKRPLVQYAITIDAGSTGSRVHVYKFQNCGPSPALEYETFKQLHPGLSAYPSDPAGAAASLNPLLEEAKRVIPQDLWSCTPVEVKATAGLRLLGESESGSILAEVRRRLENDWPFVVPNEKAVEIMDGKDEGERAVLVCAFTLTRTGVYAWITANYLLNKIGEGAGPTDTLAVMDLGGASTQIVFEPKFPASSDQDLIEGEHKYKLSFGGKDFTLYQHSYLGYGMMRARRSVHNLVAFTWSFGHTDINWDTLSENEQVPNPCLSRGTTHSVELDPPGRTPVKVTMHGATGGFEACNRVVELVMAKDE